MTGKMETPKRSSQSPTSPAILTNAHQWVDLPNSTLVRGLSPNYLARIGLAVKNGAVEWGANKLGHIPRPVTLSKGWNYGHYDYSGMVVLDDLILVGAGDAGWAENGVHGYNFKTGEWLPEVIKSCHQQDFDHGKGPRMLD